VAAPSDLLADGKQKANGQRASKCRRRDHSDVTLKKARGSAMQEVTVNVPSSVGVSEGRIAKS
jgi:hypothetical protein